MKYQTTANRQQKILIVDDEEEIRRVTAELLSEGFKPLQAGTGEEAVAIARNELPSLILLDIMMPGMDGIATCDILRQNPVTRHIPIIMVTALNDTTRRVNAFNAGADDYIAKPYNVTELYSRIHAKLRRSSEAQDDSKDPVICGNLTLDPARFEVKVSGKLIPMTSFEFRLLKLFADRAEQLVTRQEIIEGVWNDSTIPVRLIDAHIVAIRKKLLECEYSFKTVYGAGYIFRPRELEN